MTISELERMVKSWQRVQKTQAQEKAAYDYILASLVGVNVASFFSNNVEIPKLQEVYSHLFEEQVKEAEEQAIDVKTELSALRFKQFVKSYNDRFYKQEVANVSE